MSKFQLIAMIFNSAISLVRFDIYVYLLNIWFYFFSRNLHTISQKIFINSCFSMLFLILTFIIGIKRTYQPRVCHAVSVLLHYFTLTTFGWVSVEFLSMYRNVFRLYQGSRFFWTMWVFTWGKFFKFHFFNTFFCSLFFYFHQFLNIYCFVSLKIFFVSGFPAIASGVTSSFTKAQFNGLNNL